MSWAFLLVIFIYIYSFFFGRFVSYCIVFYHIPRAYARFGWKQIFYYSNNYSVIPGTLNVARAHIIGARRTSTNEENIFAIKATSTEICLVGLFCYRKMECESQHVRNSQISYTHTKRMNRLQLWSDKQFFYYYSADSMYEYKYVNSYCSGRWWPYANWWLSWK